MGDQGLLVMFGMALFHAVTHVAVHDAKERIGGFLQRPERLRNHDVQHAVERTVHLVLRRLQKDYQREFPDDSEAPQAFAALARASLAESRASDVEAPDEWLSTETVSVSFGKALQQFAPTASSSVRRFVIERFPPLFVFAFREIGLKGDEKVRAVIFESMLRRLDRSDSQLQMLLLKNDTAMRTGLQALGCDLTTTNTSVAELLGELRELRVVIDQAQLRGGQPLAYLRIEDFDGGVLRTEPICTKRFVVGRTGGNEGVAVNLDDRKISRVHAEFILGPSSVLVQDRKSTHGTFVAGERISTPRNVDFGTAIQVGSFRLVLLPADVLPEELVAAPTE